MSYLRDAETLDRFLAAEKDNLQQRVQEVSRLLTDTDAELEPIKNLILSYGLSFFNERTNGASDVGIVIGGTAETPAVLVRGAVISVSKDGGVQNNIGVLSDYLRVADLDTIKAGFDFVRKFSVNDNPITSRNKELEKFISSFKPFDLKPLIS
jgi:hypothetical protein